METIEITLDESLLRRVDRVTSAMGIARSDFIQQALQRSLEHWAIDQMEEQQRDGYERKPVLRGEFDLWYAEQTWSDS